MLNSFLINIPVGSWFSFTELQWNTMLVTGIIAAVSVLYCFIVGELTNNNSQFDKLWSIVPEVYCWVIFIIAAVNKGYADARLLTIACISTLWGIRLTYNFGRKGAYKLKFWEGEEDYRWKLLREKDIFKPHWKWLLFNLFFISIYQNFVVWSLCFPALVSMESIETFNWIDALSLGFALFFLIYESIADEQQMAFHTTKKLLLKDGKKLEEIPEPFNLGFNTTGLWNYSRHPNYLGEQGFWLSTYFFSLGAGVGIFNMSLIGPVLLILLFLGSSTLAEKISSPKYPLYKDYVSKVSRYFIWKPYRQKKK